ncbi:MAG TPA: hypothetical protein VFD70_21540 [Anaerolineae bacterium]|nr:hypothetical protein [Anaerolineae bacterium]
MSKLQPLILVREEDPAVARALLDGLKREGYNVVWKNTGAARPCLH